MGKVKKLTFLCRFKFGSNYLRHGKYYAVFLHREDCRVYTQMAPVAVFEADTAAIFRNKGFLRAVLAVKSALYGF